MVNKQLATRAAHKRTYWRYWDREFLHEYERSGGIPSEERRFAELGISSLSSYLSYWNQHYACLIDAAPDERLFVVRTSELSDSTARLTRFLTLNSVPRKVPRFNKTERRVQLRDIIDLDYLTMRSQKICGDMMLKMCPDVVHASALL